MCLVWGTPVILALRKLKQEDGRLKASLGYTVRPFLASLSTDGPHLRPVSFEYSAEVFFPTNKLSSVRAEEIRLHHYLLLHPYKQHRGYLLVADTIMSYLLGV